MAHNTLIRQAFERVAAHTPRPFIGPLPEANVVNVRINQSGIVYTFEIANVQPGWWRFTPLSDNTANVDEPALPHEIARYMALLPKFYVIALFPLSEMTWLVIPYNAADAAQRGWPNRQPRPLHLVNARLAPLNVVRAGWMSGDTMIYDDIARYNLTITTTGPDFSAARQIIADRNQAIEAAIRQKRIEMQKLSVEEQIKWQLQFVGAKFLDWRQEGANYVVEWEYNGIRNRAAICPNMRVESAGLCLSGRDRDYNLTAIVDVINEGRRRNRPFFNVLDGRDYENEDD